MLYLGYFFYAASMRAGVEHKAVANDRWMPHVYVAVLSNLISGFTSAKLLSLVQTLH